MHNKTSSSLKNTNLFKLYDIENDLRRHKQKINKIKHLNAKIKVKKQYSSQVNAASILKKNWMTAQLSRNISKQKQITQSNKILYDQIIKVRTRSFDKNKIVSQSTILNRSGIKTSNSVNRQSQRKKIHQQNQKLMQKILTTKSPLCKQKMKSEYKKIKQAKKRLQAYNQLNKSRMKMTLKQINVKTTVYLPEIGNQFNQRNVKQSILVKSNSIINDIQRQSSIKEINQTRISAKEKQENQFMNGHTLKKILNKSNEHKPFILHQKTSNIKQRKSYMIGSKRKINPGNSSLPNCQSPRKKSLEKIKV